MSLPLRAATAIPTFEYMNKAAPILLLVASHLSAGAQSLPPRKPTVWTTPREVLARVDATRVLPPSLQFIPVLSLIYRERTAFSSQLRLRVADLFGGRLQFDVFERKLSPNGCFRGVSSCSPALRMSPYGLTPRPDKGFGFSLSFRLGANRRSRQSTLAPYVKVQ